MGKLVVSGASLSCSQGLSPGSLITTGQASSKARDKLVATIMDFAPLTNITSFGMCNTQSNPAVAAATTAANGAHTPAPCIPAVASPWTSGSSRVSLNGMPALTDDSTCQCSYGGQVSIDDPGQTGAEGD
ncbi:DUF4280 domain-containing protein [Thioalkalicoccus limnaeus]|uniref:DUF4280 domain-containing protein n=1 Tax=Thioalkalicoccus limnaeus TaxID=120681 RepID=A0ABV4BGR0_9GAMM